MQLWKERQGWKSSSGLMGNVSNHIQPFAIICIIFNGSLGNNGRSMQPLKLRLFRWDSWMIFLGRLTKLFPLRFKNFKEDKQPITSGTAWRLQ